MLGGGAMLIDGAATKHPMKFAQCIKSIFCCCWKNKPPSFFLEGGGVGLYYNHHENLALPWYQTPTHRFMKWTTLVKTDLLLLFIYLGSIQYQQNLRSHINVLCIKFGRNLNLYTVKKLVKSHIPDLHDYRFGFSHIFTGKR
jgi:hypothetical protein